MPELHPHAAALAAAALVSTRPPTEGPGDVLVVDDDPISRLAAAATLQAAGYRVDTAENGRVALAKLERTTVQLVVSDWNMSEMSGLELCRAIRAPEWRRYVYLILLTGRDCPTDLREGLSAGADDFLTKPFDPTELTLRVGTGRRILGTESSKMTVLALARLSESRDPEAGGHLERIRTYSRLLALELRCCPTLREAVDDQFVSLIYDTSPLHDIGKVAIPDSILLKPSRLTVDEFAIMKTHAEHGAQTLAAVMAEFPHAPFLRMAHDIARYHHEWFDGRGYPCGLVGDAIPLAARIVALADAYDVLTSNRVYKRAGTHTEAVQAILRKSGTHFDPRLVAAFIRLRERFRDIRQPSCDSQPPPIYPARPPSPRPVVQAGQPYHACCSGGVHP